MTVVRYSATGRKTTVKVDLDKHVFSEKVDSHELLNQVYLSYMANGRANLARTKTRGEVRGGGRKPWRQKGLGRARHGSIRSPIWKGGGVTFGPIGRENYSNTVNKKAKRKALRQALTLAVKSGKFKVVETFTQMDKKTKDMASFLAKVDANGKILCVVSEKDPAKEKAARNIPNLKISAAKYLNTYDILNADTILISDKSLEIVNQDLKGAKK